MSCICPQNWGDVCERAPLFVGDVLRAGAHLVVERPGPGGQPQQHYPLLTLVEHSAADAGALQLAGWRAVLQLLLWRC